jgi:hypothetical protein
MAGMMFACLSEEEDKSHFPKRFPEISRLFKNFSWHISGGKDEKQFFDKLSSCNRQVRSVSSKEYDRNSFCTKSSGKLT